MKKRILVSILLTSLIVLGGLMTRETFSQNVNEALAFYAGESKTDETVKVLWDEEAWVPTLYNFYKK